MKKKQLQRQAANLASAVEPHRRPNREALDAMLAQFTEPTSPVITPLVAKPDTANDTPRDIATDTANSTAENTAINPATYTAESKATSPATSPTLSLVNNTATSPAESTAQNRATNRVANTATSPAMSTATRSSDSPAISPTRNTAESPAMSTAGRPVIRSGKVKGQPLDATHTSTEQKLYSVLYRLTVTQNENPRRFTNVELQGLTGLGSNKTVLRGLRGLCAKLSLVITNREGQNRYGIEMLVRTPNEILTLRQQCGLRIEPVRKAIVGYTDATRYEQLLRLNVMDDMTGDIADDLADDRAGYHAPMTQPAVSDLHSQTAASMMINNKGDDALKNTNASSPITAPVDEEKLAKVRDLFEQLSNGGHWKAERDEEAYRQIQHVSLWHIIAGLASSLLRCQEHRFNSLKYAVPAILEHYEQMKHFPEGEMLTVAYQQMRRALICRDAGKWTVPEWEAGQALPPDSEPPE
jgi:hypothetical protein